MLCCAALYWQMDPPSSHTDCTVQVFDFLLFCVNLFVRGPVDPKKGSPHYMKELLIPSTSIYVMDLDLTSDQSRSPAGAMRPGGRGSQGRNITLTPS